MSKKPAGFNEFDALMKKLVKVPPGEVPPKPEPLTCKSCGSTDIQLSIYSARCRKCGHGWQFAFS